MICCQLKSCGREKFVESNSLFVLSALIGQVLLITEESGPLPKESVRIAACL